MFVFNMENTLQMEINKISIIFPKCFISNSNELILDPKQNIYFLLYDVKTVLDFKCKFIAYVSRYACKGSTLKKQALVREKFNRYLGTHFSEEDILYYIYTKLGCDANRELCKKFVESNYDLSVISNSIEYTPIAEGEIK